ncbi:MAG TPA: hypothetical protein VFL17_20145 [Anaerolineae bacterium]|nr:hypothetical protein [Anaerolineae bacterium]
MKLYSFAIVVVAALAVGGLLGFSLGNGSEATGVNVAQPDAVAPSSAVEAPVQVPVEAPVGAVGVLQAVSAEGLSLETREGLQFMTITGPAAGIEQLKVGDKVAVWAQKVNGQLAVKQIAVVPETPQRMHYLGLVANSSADRIELVGQQGETTSFRIDAATQRMPDASRAPQVGDTVTVVAKPDPLGDGWLAVAIVTR